MSRLGGGLLALFLAPLLFAAAGRASPPAGLQFSVDVTEVDDSAGLVHALGWPIVVGDRLDGTIRVDPDSGQRLRGRLQLSCGRLDFEHASLRFSLEQGDGRPLRLSWLGGTTRRIHGGSAIRILASIHPDAAGDHVLSIDLQALDEGQGDLHDTIRGTLGPIRESDTTGVVPWLPVSIGIAVAIVAALAGLSMLRRRHHEDALASFPRGVR